MNKAPQEYLEGIALFNQRKFFEAHEVWESVWMGSGGELRIFYQALIQAAAALLHRQNSNRTGEQHVMRACLEKFGRLPDAMLGLNIREFCKSLADNSKVPAIELHD